MRNLRLHFLVILLLLPLGANGSRLTSISGSEKTRESFTILALHFDMQVPYSVQEFNDGQSLRLTIPGGSVDPEAAAELRTLKNRLISQVQITEASGAMHLQFDFAGKMKPVVWETRNPFSLVLDISVVEWTQSPPQKTEPPARKEEPPVQKTETPAQKSAANTKQQRTFVPAGTQASKPKNKELEALSQPSQSSSEIHDRQTEQPQERHAVTEYTSPEVHFEKGLALHRQGQLHAALEHLGEARKDPLLYAKSTAEIANIYHLLGETDEEVAAWEELFEHLRETGYQLPEESPVHMTPAALADGHETVAASSGSGGSSLLVYLLLVAVLLTFGALFMLNKKITNLRAIIGGEIPEPSPPPPPPKKPKKPKAAAKPAPEPELPPAEPAESPEPEPEEEEPVAPWGGDEEESTKPAEETAMEVISLSEQGYSIQEIAEKLGLGQDEVRLILNLQREESTSG